MSGKREELEDPLHSSDATSRAAAPLAAHRLPLTAFLPDQAAVPSDVLEAMLQAGSASSAAAQGELLLGLQSGLRTIFRTRQPVLIAGCPVTGFMEAAIRNGVRHRVLVVIGGAQGEWFAEIAERCGKEVVRAAVPPGRTMEAEYLARFLDGPEVDAVALVHAELSTGTLAPLEELARVVRSRPDVALLVNAAGSVGGLPVETDLLGLDFVFAGSQKALALPAGLALGVISPSLYERARDLSDRGRLLDLVAHRDAALGAEPVATPPLPLLLALKRQLSRIDEGGGIEARWRRHRELLRRVEQWVTDHPAVGFLAVEGRRAWTVSCLRLPPSLKAPAVVERLRAGGWAIGEGVGKLRESTIRIGHMGEVQVEDLEGLLGGLGGMVGG